VYGSAWLRAEELEKHMTVLANSQERDHSDYKRAGGIDYIIGIVRNWMRGSGNWEFRSWGNLCVRILRKGRKRSGCGRVLRRQRGCVALVVVYESGSE